MNLDLEALNWVDEFIANVRPYIFVRREDNLLIKRPNQAQKLNPTGALILERLLGGASVAELVRGIEQDGERLQQIAAFLHGVRLFLEGKLDADIDHPGVVVEPFDRHFSTLPVLSEVALTYDCNLRCVFCYAGCNCTTQPVDDPSQMTAPEVKGLLRRIYEEGQVPSVSFTGGEPTLRPELPEFIAYARELGMRVNLISNGIRIDSKYAQRLAEAGLNSAQISLEGITAAVHDEVTQGQGSFEKTVAAVGFLREAGVRVHTNTTLNRLNLEQGPLFPHFVREILGNERFSMNLLVPTGSATVHRDLIVPYTEIGPWLERISEASEKAGVEFMWYSPTPMCIFNPIPRGLGNHGCSACDGLISVAPNGDLIPCASYDDSLGNLLEEDLLEVWNSPRAVAYRDKQLAHPGCRACEQFDLCNGGCPLYWREMGFDELERLHGFAVAKPLRAVPESSEEKVENGV